MMKISSYPINFGTFLSDYTEWHLRRQLFSS